MENIYFLNNQTSKYNKNNSAKYQKLSNLITNLNHELDRKLLIHKKHIRRHQQYQLQQQQQLNQQQQQNSFKITNNKNKDIFRLLCNNCNTYLKLINIPNIQLNKPYEAVLIEYRILPHMDFLIRNTIFKLGNEWSHTVICGNENYESVKKMCFSIHPNIKVIKTNYDQMTPATYNVFLTSLEFWNLLVGDKILIYQEDSCIFKDNIKQFLNYDYIGAPWPYTQNDNPFCVGNGGFSLRTRQNMIDVINTISVQDTKFNTSTIEYINNANLLFPPEDVYFSLNMIKFNIGKVAPFDIATLFSTEQITNYKSLGGHNFWLNDPFWQQRVTNLVATFTPNYNKNELTHRGGWSHVLDNGLIKYGFYNSKSSLDFYDMADLNIEQIIETTNNGRIWAGIFHFTPKTPKYLSKLNIKGFFKNAKFVSTFKKCLFVVTLCDYLYKYLKTLFEKLNIIVPIYVIKHPVVMDVPQFKMNKYIDNPKKSIIQIGKQLRKVTSIYLLQPIPNHQKLWLTGTPHYSRCTKLLNDELTYLNLSNFQINIKDVKMFYTTTFAEYDEYLNKNIVFIDLWDATANNAVLECICRNTPLIVNKVAGVVDYLGENYPLYFNHLDEVPQLITQENILAAHNYLKQMDKTELHLDHFVKTLFNIAYKHNPN